MLWNEIVTLRKKHQMQQRIVSKVMYRDHN